MFGAQQFFRRGVIVCLDRVAPGDNLLFISGACAYGLDNYVGCIELVCGLLLRVIFASSTGLTVYGYIWLTCRFDMFDPAGALATRCATRVRPLATARRGGGARSAIGPLTEKAAVDL